MTSIKGIIIEENYIEKALPHDIDLFISGISLEDRCPQGNNILIEKGISPKKKIIFAFREVLENWIAERPFGENNFEHAIKHFRSLFALNESDSHLITNISNEVDGLGKLQELINSEFENKSNLKVIIDYSVMVKPYIFVLLKFFLISKRINEIFLIYTEPSKYYKDRTSTISKERELFTRGSRDIMDIPGYSGKKDISKDKALSILLGFEGERARNVVDDINPEVIVPINGFPAYKPEIKDLSIIFNEELLKDSEVFTKLRYAPANDPFETMSVLKIIYSQYISHYNFSIAPLGTKPMALGACLFALENPDTRIVYPYPQEYNSKTSIGYGPSWLYIVEKNDGNT